MLVLPIRPRATTEEALKGEEQNGDRERAKSEVHPDDVRGVATASSPLRYAAEGLSVLTPGSERKMSELSDGGGSGLRLTVKNTFIDLEEPEDALSHRSSLHERGAQTCSARLSEPTPSSMLMDSPASIQEEHDEDREAERESLRRRLLPTGATGSPQHSSPTSSAARSPLPAPPGYSAPAFKEENMSPPPEGVAGSSAFGQQLFTNPLHGLVTSPATSRSPNDDSVKVVVKNTFIDLQPEDLTPVNDRVAQSCTARFSMPAKAAAFMLPQTVEHPEIVATHPAAPPGAPAMVPVPQAPPPPPGGSVLGLAAPSPGSALHGQLDANGEPACQPCAWFYKGSGCQNGATCRRCHLCPEGELKIRKKLKIAKLRSAEAAAAAAEGLSPGPAGLSPLPASSAGSVANSPPGALGAALAGGIAGGSAVAAQLRAAVGPVQVQSPQVMGGLSPQQQGTPYAMHVSPSGTARWADLGQDDKAGKGGGRSPQTLGGGMPAKVHHRGGGHGHGQGTKHD